MSLLKILINTTSGEGYESPFKAEDPSQLKDLEVTHAIILEKGTTGGKTSILFRLVDGAGQEYSAQMTARILVNGLASATKGACARFGDDLDKP